ncbi:MAG: TonB-dependent receptor domain-containing protein [Gemmatimonadales bacterium]
MTLAIGALLLVPSAASAQGSGSVAGRVTDESGAPVSGITVSVVGTGIVSATNNQGRYSLSRVPAGLQTVLFRRLGFAPLEQIATVAAGETVTLDVTVSTQAITLGNIMVEGASRAPERVVEAPAAISIIEPRVMQNTSITGQAPLAISNVPGMDVVQSGVNDFNINARGFNSSLNRRILVLQDGRDLALAFLGSQEWNALALPLEDLGTLEIVRGPGSALYGANAFSGVINITTPLARDVLGTKVSLGGGELNTLRADLRHALVTSDGRFGARVNVGFSQSGTWSRTRTTQAGFGTSDILLEYKEATGDPGSGTSAETRPLNGVAVDSATGAPLENGSLCERPCGEGDDLRSIYGSARFDYYADDGSVGTVEGGIAQVQNEVFVTGIGRVQVLKAIRPWARLGWSANDFNLMAWYSGRNSVDPQFSLGAGLPLEEKSAIYHVEGQYNRSLLDNRARLVLGSSYRIYNVDTEGTLMALQNDDRSDAYYSGFAQIEYTPTDQIRLVGAARVDGGDLFDTQFSPKGAIVFSPTEDHAIRFTVNSAFQTPNYSEFFLNVPVADPTTSPGALEQALEGYFQTITASLGAAVADLNIPAALPWDFNDTTFASAFGNAALDVETVLSFELGYKGNVGDRAFVGIDLYWSELENFVTDLLPGVNPLFPRFALDETVDAGAVLVAIRDRLVALGLQGTPLWDTANSLITNNAALTSLVGNLLATNPNGDRAIVVSYGNAGEVTERGVEISGGYVLSDEVQVSGSYSFFDFSVREGTQAAGDQLIPNTPEHKGTIAVSYTGRQGLDLGVQARFVDGFDWAAGVFSGPVPSSQTVNVNLAYRVNSHLRIHAVATNVMDQQRYHLYGGSVIGRRVLAGVTATF